MDNKTIIAAYRRFSYHYDYSFGYLTNHGRRVAVEKMAAQAGERVLEVGVGTGMSLPFYNRRTQVAGIDLSPDMLEKAKQRCVTFGYNNVELKIMDAENLEYADDYFDHAVAMYVVTVASDPVRVLQEMKRVCKPGGHIFILNHFYSKNLLVRSLEKMFSPLEKLVGFKPGLDIDNFIAACSLDVVNVSPVNIFGFWTLIHAKNE